MKLSVIVPVYNTENYLEHCIKSIMSNQVDLEIILVDDGSKDGSAMLCDRLAKENNKIKVIHKENGGISTARNAGLKIATGEYIAFVDSDDYIDSTIYSDIIEMMDANNYECVKFRNIGVYDQNYVFEQNQSYKHTLMNREDALDWMFRVNNKSVSFSSCNIVVKREIMDGLTFLEGINSEDVIMQYDIINKSKNFCLLDRIGYAYFQRRGSVSMSRFNLMSTYIYKVWEIVEEKNKDKNRREIIRKNVLYYKFVYLMLMARDKKYLDAEVYNSIKKEMWPIIKKNKKMLKEFRGMDSKRKVLLFLACINFELAGFALRIYRR